MNEQSWTKFKTKIRTNLWLHNS